MLHRAQFRRNINREIKDTTVWVIFFLKQISADAVKLLLDGHMGLYDNLRDAIIDCIDDPCNCMTRVVV